MTQNFIPITKPYLSEQDTSCFIEPMQSGWVSQGAMVESFEQSLCKYTGAKHAIAVSSGTTALHFSLLAEGVEAGDEIIVPSYSFIATANVVKYCHAKPIFADISQGTPNICLKDIEKKLTSKTKGIIAVDQIGYPLDIEALKKFCGNYSGQKS